MIKNTNKSIVFIDKFSKISKSPLKYLPFGQILRLQILYLPDNLAIKRSNAYYIIRQCSNLIIYLFLR